MPEYWNGHDILAPIHEYRYDPGKSFANDPKLFSLHRTGNTQYCYC